LKVRDVQRCSEYSRGATGTENLHVKKTGLGSKAILGKRGSDLDKMRAKKRLTGSRHP